MSTKTIAVDSKVHARLAAAKQEGESFSRAIERLLATAGQAHTGTDVLRRLDEIPELPTQDAELFLAAVDENRSAEHWAR